MQGLGFRVFRFKIVQVYWGVGFSGIRFCGGFEGFRLSVCVPGA